MPMAVLNGVKTHYLAGGDGPDVLLVHGLASDLAFWYLGAMPLLQRRFRIIAYDLRGHGYSDMPRSGYTSESLAQDARALLDHLGVRRAHVVGHSFGGSVALHLALLEPDRVASLTLADARVHALQAPLPPRRSAHWREVDEALRRQGIDLPASLPAVFYHMLEELLETPDGRAAGAGRQGPLPFSVLTGGGSKRKIERWVRLVETTTARHDFNAVAGLTVERIRSIQKPCLSIYGERSRCLDSCRGLAANLPVCTTVMLKDAGHLHPLAQPGTFAGHVEPFLAAREAAA